MDAAIQLEGLDRFLTAIYGEATPLASMLKALGFEPAQADMLTEERMQAVAGQFVEVLRKKLTSGEKDLWFQLLSRRYGFDGEPAVSIEEAARTLDIDLAYASRAEGEALQKCRFKTTLQDFRKELHRIALAELSHGAEKPQKTQVVAKLNRLADLKAAVDLTRMDLEAKRLEVLKKVQAELDALEAEYQPVLDAAQENASSLEAEVKNDVLLSGQSVATDLLQAIYVKGRVSWDNEGIHRYARTHPEVLKFRKEGQPSVSLRIVGPPTTEKHR
jgi:hypothetical protein